MAITLITTAGSATANSYSTLIEANAYFATKYHTSSWDGADGDVQRACLAWATRLLDQLVIWQGYKYTEEQALRWPRSSVVDSDGYEIDYTTIPQFLKNATAEFAGHLLIKDRTLEPGTKGFTYMKVGSLELKTDKKDMPDVLPDSVYTMIVPFGYKQSDQPTRLVRV